MQPALLIRTEPKKNNIKYFMYKTISVLKKYPRVRPHAQGRNNNKKPIGLFNLVS